MGIWARAWGKEPPLLPAFNVAAAVPGLDWPEDDDPARIERILLAAAYADRGYGVWRVSVACNRTILAQRSENSLLRAFVWAATQGQVFANEMDAAIVFGNSSFTPSTGGEDLARACWRGEAGDLGYAMFGPSENEPPPLLGMVRISPQVF